MSEISGKNILITGGARGIGALMAKEFLGLGAENVILWDISQEELTKIAKELGQGKGRVISQVVDVSNLAEMKSALLDLAALKIPIDILINNAGIVVGKKFIDHSHDEIHRTLAINVQALMNLTLLVLPQMRVRAGGHIVNIASAAAMVSNPDMSVYCASKWAVAGWSDSLRIELEREGRGVKVTTVFPYYINTGMFDGVKSPILPILRPEYVAHKIIQAVRKDRIVLRMPRLLYIVRLLQGLLGTRLFDLVAGEGFGIYRSMRDFKGRS